MWDVRPVEGSRGGGARLRSEKDLSHFARCAFRRRSKTRQRYPALLGSRAAETLEINSPIRRVGVLGGTTILIERHVRFSPKADIVLTLAGLDKLGRDELSTAAGEYDPVENNRSRPRMPFCDLRDRSRRAVPGSLHAIEGPIRDTDAVAAIEARHGPEITRTTTERS